MARVQVVDMKYNPSSGVMAMYSHRSTGFHYRVRDPDTSSREAMELSSFRLRNKVGGSAQDRDNNSLQGEMSSPDTERGPFDSKTSAEKGDNIKLGEQAKMSSNKLPPSSRARIPSTLAGP